MLCSEMQALAQHLGPTLSRAALVQALNTLHFKRILGKDSPNIKIQNMLRQEILEAGCLTEARRPQRLEASCPLRGPAAQQVLVQDAGEAKVGLRGENA